MGLFSSKFSAKRMAHFCHHLHATLSGGIPINRALALMSEESAGRPFRRVLPPMIDILQRGGSLAEAFRAQSKYFPENFMEMLVAGEAAGRIDTVLRDMTGHYEEVLRLQRGYVQGAIYPIMVVLTAFIFIPYVLGLLASTGSVEGYTLRFIWRFVAGYGPLFLILVVLGRLGVLRWASHHLLARLWGVRRLWYRLALAWFCRSMAITLGAGLDVRQSIERSAAVVSHPKMKAALRVAVPMVQNGANLAEALAETGVLPDMVLDMVFIGEHAGKLEELFAKAADYLYQEAMNPARALVIGFEGYLILAGFLLFVLGSIIQQAVMALILIARLIRMPLP